MNQEKSHGIRKNAILSVEKLEKSYGSKRVHRSVSFDLYEGEILGLFGGSGTGKSVILRSIIGLEKPDAGEIIFQNENLTSLREREFFKVRSQIGYVFQNGALFDSMSVEDNLAYPLQEHTDLDPWSIHEKVNSMLDRIDMKGSNLLYPNELSGGMQKRVGLARAIILEPKIILFDEPTAGLDPTNTRRLLSYIKKLKTTGMTGIFVTHDIPSAFEIADRIAILYQGEIPVIATPEELQKSKDPLVMSFVSDQNS